MVIKGGPWKNTEDEVLRAAVMKYGKNEWARVASLLNRKSPKQCKARWYEWLDPSIKKTEWTREEEEKLLHLAKIFPNQWKTIAPVVGRTAQQCLEHYEKLLDQAQDRDKDLDIMDDPRKLRPGEIDPNPESKPARPDAIDLDEDEKEMLSEARARLANTQGKKEKRKMREQKLEEARRLALLQKRRELKNAGVHIDLVEKRKKKNPKGGPHIDYNKEVPFKRTPVVGFYDIGEENTITKIQSFGIPNKTIREMEGKRKLDEIEKDQKEEMDKKKKKKDHLPELLKQMEHATNRKDQIKRSQLTLPNAQVQDDDLEQVGKILGKQDGNVGEDSITNKLLTNQMRTPSIGGDYIRNEAKTQAILSQMQTPLEGGHNHTQGMEFTPSKGPIMTPNALLNATPKMISTPIVRLNTLREEKQRQELIRQQLRDSIDSLPKPLHETYHFSVKSLKKSVNEEDVIDEEDIEKMKNLEQTERERIAQKKRSQVFQKNFPIPTNFHIEENLNSIEHMIQEEMKELIDYDSGKNQEMEQFKLVELNGAKALLEQESSESRSDVIDINQFESIWLEQFHRIHTKPLEPPQLVSLEKLESKLNVLTGGYVIRGKKLNEEAIKIQNEIYQLKIQLDSFYKIADNESQAIPKRIAMLKEQIEFEKEIHDKLQQEYANRKAKMSK